MFLSKENTEYIVIEVTHYDIFKGRDCNNIIIKICLN